MSPDRNRPSTWCIVFLLAFATHVSAEDDRLIEAVKAKDEAAIEQLLKENVDLDARLADGATAMHWAVYLDDGGLTTKLVRAGARVDVANDYGVTPLALACTNRNPGIVESLLNAGANANAVMTNGETVLMTCARTGSLAGVRALVAHGATVDATEEWRGQTALMWAAACGHLDVVRVLLEAGANVNARSRVTEEFVKVDTANADDSDSRLTNVNLPKGGFAPLLFAAREGRLGVADVLIEAGAGVNALAADGNSVLTVASFSGHGGLAALLLDKGADPNASGAGYTALHAAVLKGDLPLVRTLLAHGADPNVRMTKGSPARRFGQTFVMRGMGATPFLLAAKYAEVEIMRALAAAGADPLLTLTNGTTPLMVAAGLGWNGTSDRRDRSLSVEEINVELDDVAGTIETVALAINLGANVNATNGTGDTALHGAARKGFKVVVEFLVEKGGSLDLKNSRDETAGELIEKWETGIR